jgi:type III restriction enzyme
VLASLANKTSTIDVEQIVGRILRQPYAKQHSSPLLNSSYVLTCSADYHNTLENIIIGLNRAGFTRKDYRVADKTSDTEDAIGNSPAAQTTLTSEQFDTFADIQTADVKAKLSGEIPTEKDQIEGLLAEAINKTQEYESQVASSDDNVFIDGELGEMLSQYKMQTHFLSEAQNIRIPQFYLKTVPDLLGEEYSILEPENLSEGFLLRGQDSQVNFELATGDLYQVDVQTEGDSLPKYKRVSKEESEFLRGYLSKLPEDEKISYCADIIARLINRNNRFSAKDIQDYVQRVISGMSKDELAAMETASPIYARKIIQKI